MAERRAMVVGSNGRPEELPAGDTLAGSGGVFGSEYEHVTSTGESSTTSATFQDKISLTTASKPAGNYHVEFSYLWKSNTGTSMEVRLLVDGSPAGGTSVHRVSHNSVYDRCSFHIAFTAGVGTHTLKLQWRGQSAGSAQFIKEARVSIWRVS